MLRDPWSGRLAALSGHLGASPARGPCVSGDGLNEWEGLLADKASSVIAVRVTVSRGRPCGKLLGDKLPELVTFVTLA